MCCESHCGDGFGVGVVDDASEVVFHADGVVSSFFCEVCLVHVLSVEEEGFDLVVRSYFFAQATISQGASGTPTVVIVMWLKRKGKKRKEGLLECFLACLALRIRLAGLAVLVELLEACFGVLQCSA